MSAKAFSRNRRKIFLLWIQIGLVFIMVICVGLLWLLFRSSLFRVREISVDGARLISPERFVPQISTQLVGESVLRSLIGPRNILFWAVGGEYPEVSPYVFPALSRFRVDLSFFERKVVLHVEEREFFGIWCSYRKQCFAFDEQGILFNPVPQASGSLFLTILDTNPGRYGVLGAPFLTRETWVQNIMSVVLSLRNEGFGIARISILDITLREWEIETDSGQAFRFDLAFIPDHFQGVLRELHARFRNDSVLLDFRVPNRVYYRL